MGEISVDLAAKVDELSSRIAEREGLSFPRFFTTELDGAGLLINCTAGTVLRFLPPYVIEHGHIDQLVQALDAMFEQGPPAEA